MNKITNETKSAIIGYWRCGAILEQICVITGIAFWKIDKIITDYKNTQINTQ